MFYSRFIIPLIAVLFSLLCGQRDLLAKDIHSNSQQVLSNNHQTISEAPSRFQFSSDVKNAVSFQKARYVYNTGISLAIIGGMTIIAGSVFSAVAANTDCHSQADCGLESDFLVRCGAYSSITGGLFLLTPGVVIAVAGKIQMNNLLNPREIKDYDAAFQGYKRLRRSGIVLSVIGGSFLIAGAAGAGYAIGIGKESLLTTTFTFGSGLFLLTPGFIMAVAGDRKMSEVRKSKSTHTTKAFFRPTFKGLSVLASA